VWNQQNHYLIFCTIIVTIIIVFTGLVTDSETLSIILTTKQDPGRSNSKTLCQGNS